MFDASFNTLSNAIEFAQFGAVLVNYTIIISGTYFVDRSSSTSRAILSNLKNSKTVLVILTYNTGE